MVSKEQSIVFKTVILQEDFQNPNKSDWFISKGVEIKDEALFQLVLEKNRIQLSTWNKSGFTNLEDVDFSADVRKISGSDNEYFGIMTKYNNFKFYYLVINNNRNVIFGSSTSKKFINKVDLNSLSVNVSNTNKLRIVCNGNKIIGYINDKMIGSFEDNSISSGKIGFISLSGEREGVAVYFDNVLVKIK